MQSLCNTLLVAMPTMEDPRFKHAVTYLFEHSEDGAMGLVINQPTNITLGELLDQIKIVNDKSSSAAHNTIYSGGPVSQDRGFVLHSTRPGYSSSAEITSEIMLTTSKDVLAELTTANAPSEFIVTLGYAGWSAGQLEQELLENTWLTVPADPELVFHTPPTKLWEAALARLGVSACQLSQFAGHA
jgi:putative transcriptional regulator